MNEARLLRACALAAALSCAGLLVASGCGAFHGNDDEASADGGTGPVTARDLHVTIDWPKDASLNPAELGTAANIRVSVTDANDAAHTAAQDAPKTNRGPYDFPRFTSSGRVDAIVEIANGEGRLVGYGEARAVDVSASPSVEVVVRRRILYAVAGDGNGSTDPRDVRVMDLAPETLAEPAILAADEPLATLPAASALVLSGDARLLAVAYAADATGRIAVFETSTHAKARDIDIAFPPSEMIVLGGGNDVLVMPSRFGRGTTFARVSLDSGVVTSVPSGLQGGDLEVTSAAASLDGKKVTVVGNREPGGSDPAQAYVMEYDATTGTSAAPVLLSELARVTAVRVSHDGDEIVVAGWSGPNDSQPTGKILTLASMSSLPTVRVTMAEGRSKPAGLLVHPAGERFFVSGDTVYTNPGACCGDLFVYDGSLQPVATFAMTDNGPEYQIASAIRLPYGANVILAGQTDPGNNVHGPMLVIPPSGDRPAEIKTQNVGGDTLQALASPFARRL